MSFTAIIKSQGTFTAVVNGSAAVDMTAQPSAVFNVGMATVGPSGLLTADAPLIYDGVLKNLSINLSDYATLGYVNSTFQTIAGMSDYLTISNAAATYYPLTNPAGYITSEALNGYATESWVISKDYETAAHAASTYYPLTNPSGYITSSALAPYETSAHAAATYQTIAGMSSYATLAYTNAQLALKLDKPTVGPLDTQILAYDATLGNVWIDNAARSLFSVVRNETGALLPKGTVVYISGASGNKPLVQKAIASTEAGSSKTFAILSQDIPNNQNGNAITVGELTKMDTFGYAEGTGIWLSPTTAGGWTTTKPHAPNHAVFLGNIIRAHQTQGVIEVRIQNGYELDELHDVAVLDRINNDILVYESSTSLWKGKTISEILGYTPLQPSDLAPYLLSQTAASTYYPLTNPSNYITASALSGYATESWVASQGYLTAPYNPFDQSLNKADYVQFNNVSVGTGAGGAEGYDKTVVSTAQFTVLEFGGMGSPVRSYLSKSGLYLLKAGAGITFPDNTVQTTAAITPDLSPYLTIVNAAATYYPLSNPSGYINASALTGYATQSFVTSQGYITSSALTPYLTISSASATYQPISGMSAYYLASNPDGFITSAALGGYATESWVSSQGYLTAPYNPFDQSLNKDDQPTFKVLFVNDPASGFETIAIRPQSIDFHDGTVQTTAWTGTYNPFNQTLNTGDTVQFLNATIGDTSSYAFTWLGFSAAGGLYYAGSPIVSIDGSGIGILQEGMRLLFPDGTTQTTAWTGTAPNPFNQSLNTSDYVRFTSCHATDNGTAFPASSIAGAWSFTANQGTYTDVNGDFVVQSDTTFKQTKLMSDRLELPAGGYIHWNGNNAYWSEDSIFLTNGIGSVQLSVSTGLTLASGTGLTFGDGSTQSTAAVPTPDATTTVKGKVELATTAEVVAGTDTERAVTAEGVWNVSPTLLMRDQYLSNYGAWGAAVTGGMTTVQAGTERSINTGTSTAIGSAILYQYGYLTTRGTNQSSGINWAKRVVWTMRMVRYTTNPSAGCVFRAGIGKTQAGLSAGDLVNRGIGVRIQGSGALELQVHNGTTLTNVTSTYTPVANVCFDITLTNDGAGNVVLYVDGVQVASTNQGPTTSSNFLWNSYFEVQQVASVTTTARYGFVTCRATFFE